MAVIKVNSDEILESMKIAGRNSNEINFRYGIGVNQTDYICFSKSNKIEEKVESEFEVCVPLETKIYNTAFGEDIAGLPIIIYLRLIDDNKKRVSMRIHNCYSKKCLNDTINKFRYAQNHPVKYSSKDWGKGVGLEFNDEQLLIPIPFDKMKKNDIFKDLDIVHKSHFDKIEKI